MSPGQDLAQAGIRALVEAPRHDDQRLPTLELVMARFAQALARRLGSLLGGEVRVRLDEQKPCRFDAWAGHQQPQGILLVFEPVEWHHPCCVKFQGELSSVILEALLGGRRGGAPIRREGMACTAIAARLLERFVRQMLDDLGRAFAQVTPVTFRLSRAETGARATEIVSPASPCITVALAVELPSCVDALHILFPAAALEPVRALLARKVMGEDLGLDRTWQDHWAQAIWSAEIELEATLDARPVRLSAVAALEPGMVLDLGLRADAAVHLRCGATSVASGEAGQRHDGLVVTIDQALLHDESADDDQPAR